MYIWSQIPNIYASKCVLAWPKKRHTQRAGMEWNKKRANAKKANLTELSWKKMRNESGPERDSREMTGSLGYQSLFWVHEQSRMRNGRFIAVALR